MYEIILSKKVEKFIDKLPSDDRGRIIRSLDKLRIRPESYAQRLVGDKLYKFRVGGYRLIIDILNDTVVVLVVNIGHRRNIYKK